MNLMVIIYLGVSAWALYQSRRRWWTLLWMFCGELIGLILLGIAGAFIFRGNSNLGAASFELFGTPSLAIPALVGVLHARRTARRTILQ